MTATRRELHGGSWRWVGGGAAAAGQPHGREFAFGGFPENERRRREAEVDSDMFQLSYPRPRLRWTAKLHDQFVKAVDELGGANKATPKAILSLMDVQGLTLYHLKSHLQKFRLGKTGRRLWRKELVAANYCRRRDERLPALNMEAQPPSISTAFDMNRATALVAETYDDSAVKLEEFGGVKPALLPLFPPCGRSYSPEWSELLDGGGKRAAALRPVENAPADDDYLSSLGYSSSEFALTKSFFEEVASFSGHALAADGDVFGHGSS